MRRIPSPHVTTRQARGALMALSILAALVLAACSAPPSNTGTLYVSPDGDDASGTGSAGAPFRPLTAAVNQAPAGSTINVANGVYSGASGEVFPIDVSGLTLRGQSAAGTTLTGTSAALYGLTVSSGETLISDLTVQGFGTASSGANVRITGGTVHLEDAVVSGGSLRGITIENGSVTLRSVSVSGNFDDNIHARGSAALVVVDSLISDSVDADGIDLGDAATLRLRTTQVLGNNGSGIELDGSSEADLGTTANPGGNTIKGNALEGGGSAQLEDERPTGATLISAVGNDFGVPVSGVKTGIDSFGFVWRIEGAGNQIDFGPPVNGVSAIWDQSAWNEATWQ